MEKESNGKQKVVKGTSSAVLLSVLIHGVLFLIATTLVVFTVIQKKEIPFEAPKAVERPKMKLKKPKVRVKKSSRPKSAARIVTRSKQTAMPVMDLPDLGGIGDGLGGEGISGFDIMPDLSDITLFGAGESIGNDFVGTFYDLKRGHGGKPLPPMERPAVWDLVARFLTREWNPSVLSKYYRSPRSLYATMFMVPPTLSTLAPAAFGEDDTLGYNWLAHYKGQLVYPEDIKFRFWGRGDDILTVRVNGEIVLEGSWGGVRETLTPLWSRARADSDKYILGFGTAIVGDWIELKAGEPKPMEVLIGEIPGGVFQCMLCVQVEGQEYPRNPVLHGPTLPAFKTEEPSQDLADAILYHLAEGAVSITNGPVFRDYSVPEQVAEAESDPEVPPEPQEIPEGRMRMWMTEAGESFEAEYISLVYDKVTLKDSRGKQKIMDLDRLSPRDQAFINISNPPKFNIRFLKTSQQVPEPVRGPSISDLKPYRGVDYVFGAEVEKQGNREYTHEVVIEYFVYADESDGKTCRLVDRVRSSYVPSEGGGRLHAFKGDTIRMEEFALHSLYDMRGITYGGYLITITDERGEVIQYKTSDEWLYENLEKFRSIPVGKWFDKRCNQVGPPRPGAAHRPSWMS